MTAISELQDNENAEIILRQNNTYGLILVNSQQKKGHMLNSFAKLLFDKLNEYAIHNPGLSVSIYNSGSNNDDDWNIYIKSFGFTKTLIIREYYYPQITNFNVREYTSWLLKSPKRIFVYSFPNFNLRQTKPWIMKIFKQTLNRVFLFFKTTTKVKKQQDQDKVKTQKADQQNPSISLPPWYYSLSFILIFPLLVLVIRQLRKAYFWYTILVISALFLLAFAKPNILIAPIINWTDHLTNQLINQVKSGDLKYDVLFPIITGVVFSLIVTLSFTVLRLIFSGLNKLINTTNEPWMESDLSYLFDIDTFKIKSQLETQISLFNRDKKTNGLFVVGESRGGLLAFESLSHIIDNTYPDIHLFTKDLTLASMSARPIESIWPLLDRKYWCRFSITTPANLYWRDIVQRWNPIERNIRLISSDPYTLPKINIQPIYHKNWGTINDVIIGRILQIMEVPTTVGSVI